MNFTTNRKFISFASSGKEIEEVQSDIKNGWSIVSLVPSGNRYIGVMEKDCLTGDLDHLYIPPKKKIKIAV